MDLFTIISDDVKPSENIDVIVDEICTFVEAMDAGTIQLVGAAQKMREYENWEKAARAMQAFAYTQGLKGEWWRLVEVMKERQRLDFWHSGWDAAFDYALATLIEPWEGKGWSHKDYELLTNPLRSAGFRAE